LGPQAIALTVQWTRADQVQSILGNYDKAFFGRFIDVIFLAPVKFVSGIYFK
jgi:hypothetical protein